MELWQGLLKMMCPIIFVLGLVLFVTGGPIEPYDQLYDAKHGVKMGVPNGGCDDGKTRLQFDWDEKSINYTCFNPTTPLIPDDGIKSKLHCDNVPKNFFPKHHCMNEHIAYKELLPTYGDHRPLWPKFGEYRFVPKERWLHNIEHGAVVMLYDPCVIHTEVDKLKKIVRGCIKKHIITPTTFLTPERPLALIAWGCKLEMSKVDLGEVTKFIKDYGMRGPEGEMGKDGQYDFMLLKSSAELNNVGKNEMNNKKLCENVSP